MQKQVTKCHYDFGSYVNKKRWASFWHQLDEVLRLDPESVLEIGAGSGVFKKVAEAFDLVVETVDIDKDLKPDHVASVYELPFADNSYDMIVSFQVLEHMPYENFSKALSEIQRVAKRYVIISLPDARKLWRYVFHIPRIGEKSIYIKKPIFSLPTHKFDGQHYWEVNKKGYPISKIMKDFKDNNLELEKTFRVPENLYHRFFILKVV